MCRLDVVEIDDASRSVRQLRCDEVAADDDLGLAAEAQIRTGRQIVDIALGVDAQRRQVETPSGALFGDDDFTAVLRDLDGARHGSHGATRAGPNERLLGQLLPRCGIDHAEVPEAARDDP